MQIARGIKRTVHRNHQFDQYIRSLSIKIAYTGIKNQRDWDENTLEMMISIPGRNLSRNPHPKAPSDLIQPLDSPPVRHSHNY